MNSNFPYRWSPASLTFNNYFYLFLYLYITWITINNNAPHLKSPKNQNRRAALGRPAIKITGGLELVCGRPTLALSSALVHRRNNFEQQKQNEKSTSKKQSGQLDWRTGGHNARNTCKTDTTAMKRAMKINKIKRRQSRSAALGRPAIKLLGGLQLVCCRPTLALSSALVPQTLSCLVCREDS